MPRQTVYGLLALLAACSSDPTDAGPLPAVALEIVSGGNQSQLGGYSLNAPIVVRAVNAEGAPVAGVEVAADELPPGAALEVSGTHTSPDGTLSANWRLAPRLGTQTLRLTMPTVSSSTALSVSAQSTGAAVLAISGDARTGMCAVYLDGRLGCWKVDEKPPLVPPAAVIVDGPERYRDVAVTTRVGFGGTIFGCAVTEGGDARCFEILSGSSVPSGWTVVGGAQPTFVNIKSWGGGFSLATATFCAGDASGGLWCWGHNQYGTVGDGTTANATAPQQLTIPDAVTEVSLDLRVGCALTTNGETWCWGTGSRDRLEEPAGSGPSRVVTQLRFTSMEVFGDTGLCGTTAAGILHCWGRGVPGDLWPAGSNSGPSNPTQSYIGARSIAGHEEMIFVSTADGVGAWWGDIATLHTPLALVAKSPRVPKYPFGFTTLIQQEESRTICGRNGATDPAICFRSEMLLDYPAHIVDPKLVIGFGVPGP